MTPTTDTSREARAIAVAGFMRGHAMVFRAFPDAELWGRPEEAEHAAALCEEARDLLLAFATAEQQRIPDGESWVRTADAPAGERCVGIFKSPLRACWEIAGIGRVVDGVFLNYLGDWPQVQWVQMLAPLPAINAALQPHEVKP